jgi:sialic acid synthase SpsE
MIGIKRPRGGIEPGDLSKVLGLELRNDIPEDAPINWTDLA